MELRAGFKQTELGAIPEDWEVSKIADFAPFVTSGSRGWAAYYADRGSAFIRITNLIRSDIHLDISDLRLVDLPQNDNEGQRTALEVGDVLISITADIGIVGYVSPKLPNPAYINQHIALVRFNTHELNSKFVSYFLASAGPQKRFRELTTPAQKPE